MIEAAAQSAWSTDRGQPIVAGVIAALFASKIILPAPAVIERTAIAGRARARKRVTDTRDLNRSGKRDLPADAPMPFRKDWKKLVLDSGKPNRRLYEVAVFATLRNKLPLR